MGIIERIKKLFKKTVIIKETGISKIDTDLLFIPKFEELNKNNQAMVLKYLKEVNIKDLDSIVNYTKRISEEANFNSEFLLRLYYKLTDDNNLNNQDMLYDNYNTITEINELNLCKNELLKLHEEGILRIIALNKLYEQEISRKLSFAGVFGKFEQIKRRDDIRSLEEVTEQLKISVKIIEQLIQIVNINVDANTLKVKYQDNLLSLLKNEDSNEIINKLVDEIQNLLKIFLPHYESKIIFNNENIKECLMTLSIAKRLLDLYAYKHKDEAIDIINDIEKLCNNFNYQNDIDNIMKEIFLIESKYRLFSSYLSNNENVNGALKKLYKIKFKMLVKKNYSFNEIKNKFELMCYEEFASNMLENILKGNIAFFTSDKNLPNFSSKMQTELTQRIIETIKYNHHDLSSRGILSDSQLLKLIMALSNEYDISYQERLNLFNRYHVREKTLKKRRDDGLIPYRCDLEYVDEKENKECHENVDILNMLLKIFIDYEAYNQEKEMPYSFKMNLERTEDVLKDKSILVKAYLDILQNSRLCILLPGIKNISDEFFSDFLSPLSVEKIVFSEGVSLFCIFNDCRYLKCVDMRKLYINIVVYKDGQSYNIDVARLFALRLKNDITHTKVIKRHPLANVIIDAVKEKELQCVKQLKK